MAGDTDALVHALGRIGTAFRLSRLYPAAHPAVVEATDQLGAALAGLAGLLPVELVVRSQGVEGPGARAPGASGHMAELAALLHAHGVRSMAVGVGTGVLHVRSLFEVATGRMRLDDAALGPITLSRTRRPTQHLGARPAGAPETPRPRPSVPNVFRPDALPLDIAVHRAVEAVRLAADATAQQAAAERIAALAPDVLGRGDADLLATVLAALDGAGLAAYDAAAARALAHAAARFVTPGVVEIVLGRASDGQAPAEPRATATQALVALAGTATDTLVEALRTATPEGRELIQQAVGAAGERAAPALARRLRDERPETVAAAAALLSVTGAARIGELLVPLVRHPAAAVREAALDGLARSGGHALARVAIPVLRDAQAVVRAAAARAVASAGDASATTVLARRAEEEHDELVLAELLCAMGRLGGGDALAALARFAQPGSLLRKRSAGVRSAAITALRHLAVPEARALIEHYCHDREPAVRRAAEAAML